MKFAIFGRLAAECTTRKWKACEVPHIWISIIDPRGVPIALPDNPNRLDVLRLEFDDVDEKHDGVWLGSPEQGRAIIAMQDEHAIKILDFVEKSKDRVELICVNCEAGISRSSGTAVALSLILNGHDSDIYASANYHPNAWVKTRLLRQASLRAFGK